MKRSLRSKLIIPLSFVAGAMLAGCPDDGPMENAGEKVDEAVDEAGDKLEEAGDKVEDAVDDQ